MYQNYKEKAHIYVIYIREAHPLGGPRKTPKQFPIPDPKTLEERRKAAKNFADTVQLSIPILVDTIDDRVDRVYAGWPDRIYIIDTMGRIVLKGAPGPGGFQPSLRQAPAILDSALQAANAKTN